MENKQFSVEELEQIAPINYPNDGNYYVWKNNEWVKLIF